MKWQLPTGSCVLKPPPHKDGRTSYWQLPTGSCVLKHLWMECYLLLRRQLPTGSCVLKPPNQPSFDFICWQLPTGSCVLKPDLVTYLPPKLGSYLRVAVC